MVSPTPEAGGDASRPWQSLSTGFEQARAREDSLDRLVEWPAERALLGDVTGLAVLDAGCGNGSKVLPPAPTKTLEQQNLTLFK